MNTHNKWLLYSSTLTLVSFLLVVGHISQVECGLQASPPQDEASAKVRDKEVQGNSILTRSPNTEPNVIRGHDSDKPNGAYINDGKSNSITNDLHSPHVEYNDAEEEDEEDSYGDEDTSFEEEIDATDEDYLDHNHEGPFDKPELGKCCGMGEGLNVLGYCVKLSPSHIKQSSEALWFPEKVYNTKQFVKAEISEWDIRVSHRFECPEDERIEIISDPKKFIVLSDGSLLIVHHNKIIQPLDYCMEQQIGKHAGRVVKACFSRSELCDDKQCLRKCCPDGAILEYPELRCDHSHLAHQFNFNNESRSILSGTPECSLGSYFQPFFGNYSISLNGTLASSHFSAPFHTYCVDYVSNRTLLDSPPQRKAMLCFDKVSNRSHDIKGLIEQPPSVSIMLGIAMIISAICLAIAAAISWRLPELRSLHGKCQLSHLATMFALYVCLASTQLGVQVIPQGLCTFLGVFIHICSLSSFLWLNLLCVNIYLTFRSLRPPLAARRDENKRLAFLCVYAWGIPAAFCLFLYVLDSASPGRLDPMPSPEYGVLKCLISNREAEFAYLFGPVGVLLLCNGLLFCLTAQELLCGLWRLDNSDTINFRRKSMGIVVAKLGIVMGMGWILDVVSWATGAKSSYIFYTVDLFNSLQGVFISVILLWRKRVLEVLHLRKPSICKDETLTARPFLAKNSSVNVVSNGDHDTSLVLVQDS